MSKTRRKNLWFSKAVASEFDAYLEYLVSKGADVQPNEIVNAGLVLLFRLNEQDRLNAIAEARNYDLLKMRREIGRAEEADAAASDEKAAFSESQRADAKRPRTKRGTRATG
ncbi:MAG: hypothetical protein AABZ12_00235 [Planctomycetota bacterium]